MQREKTFEKLKSLILGTISISTRFKDKKQGDKFTPEEKALMELWQKKNDEFAEEMKLLSKEDYEWISKVYEEWHKQVIGSISPR
ncbi:MAG TPA: hypothetical protein HA367_00620 [Candidatus Methanofastidiosum sp.]|nr:hypothetical protein [Methanofastidiosum sp.]